MRVAFDGQIFIDQEYGGISRYACELASHLDALPDTRAKIFAPLHRNAYLHAAPARVRGHARKLPFIKRTTQLLKLASQAIAAPSLALFKPDILHRTYYDVRPGSASQARKVLTVYDMIHERFQDMFPNEPALSAQKRRAVEASDHVVCISRQTQIDLIELFGVPARKTSVVYLGFESTAPDHTDGLVASKSSMDRPYILYVGSRGGYKNFSRLVQAFAASPVLRSEFALMCFGGGTFSTAEHDSFRQAGLAVGDVLHVGGGDKVLRQLYTGASLFVYPSLYEGFGIPPLEAMAMGCPVVSGNSGSIPEVVGDAALQCDAMDVEAIQVAMEKVLGSKAFADELRRLGHQQCQAFSWQACAKQTRLIYQKLL